MFKLLRNFRRLLIVLVLALIVVFFGTNILVDGVIRRAVESGATQALDVGVTIDHLDLGLLRGRVGMSEVAIDNPAGFDGEHVLTFETGSVELEVGSLLSDVVNIKDIQLDGITVLLEQKAVFNNNLKALLDNISRDDGGDEPSGKKLHIDNLDLTRITVKVLLSDLPGGGEARSVSIPPIRMQDIGGDEPIGVGELTSKIVVALLKGVLEDSSGVVPDNVIGGLKDSLKAAGRLTETLTEKGKELLRQGAETGEKIMDGLGDLLKKE